MESKLLDRVRALLAKAESTEFPAEAEQLTAKAAELMAKHGIDQALLDASQRPDNKPTDRKIVCPDPYAREKSNLLFQLARSMGCQAIQLTNRDGGVTMHVFGFGSDIERVEILYTSLLLQMATALRVAQVPSYVRGRKLYAWRRSFMFGFIGTVAARVQAAEHKAKDDAEKTTAPGTALVLADRSLQVKTAYREAYPNTTTRRITSSGGGYGAGRAAGQQANLGGTGVGRSSKGALR